MLFRFDICKVMQRQYQTVENREAVNDRSIVEADFYAKRFKEFVFEHVFRPADDELATHPISMHVFSTSHLHHDSTSHLDPSAMPKVHRV